MCRITNGACRLQSPSPLKKECALSCASKGMPPLVGDSAAAIAVRRWSSRHVMIPGRGQLTKTLAVARTAGGDQNNRMSLDLRVQLTMVDEAAPDGKAGDAIEAINLLPDFRDDRAIDPTAETLTSNT